LLLLVSYLFYARHLQLYTWSKPCLCVVLQLFCRYNLWYM
jgi:hypothetical protein